MEKDTLLEIIAHDLKEVESLIQSFKGKTSISQAYFRLTRKRIDSILDELEMLEELNSESANNAEISRKTKAEILEKTEIVKEITEESKPEEKKEPEKKTPKPTEIEPDEESFISEKTTDENSETTTNEPATTQQQEEATVNGQTEEEKKNTNQSSENYNSQEPEPKAAAELKKEGEPVNNQTVTPPSTNNQTETTSSKKGTTVLGEKLRTEKASYNEHFAKNSAKTPNKRSFTSPPISDLKKALGLNDRFFYQRELFGGNADVMNQTLEQLNQMNGIEDARNFLFANFNWNHDDEAVVSFLTLIERRFPS